jgi:hypothetical protein
MLNKKTIQINPELFKISGGKTRKNREKKELSLNPNVTPNNLKNRLLKRIKEHKNGGTNKPSLNPSQGMKQGMNQCISQGIKQGINTTQTQMSGNYSNEFFGALDYLSDLTKKYKVNEAKQRSLNSKTLKNYNSNSQISLELPPELQETKTFIPQTNDVFNVNYKVTDDVPYGCLKNGKKKTYREWKQLSQPDITDIIRPPTPPKKNVSMSSTSLRDTSLRDTSLRDTSLRDTSLRDTSLRDTTSESSVNQNNLSREERLEQIKNKLKKIQDQETQIKQQSLDDFKNLEKKLSTPLMDNPLEELELDSSYRLADNTCDIEDIIKQREDDKEQNKNKKYLKKTVKRKFTLGKSDKLRRVSILIKDRQTRKNIINTQKEIKKTTLTDIKKYLRQHGIIKIGSTCPADVLRKTFESAVLAGEITNTNKETLLHNFLSYDKQD